MGTDAGGFTVVQHHNLVGVAHRVGALRDDDGGHAVAALGGEFGDGPPQRRVGGKVQCACAVVQDEDFRLAHQCPGDGQALLLPAGKVFAALQNHAVQSVRHLADKGRCLRCFQRLPDLLIGGVLLAPLHVLAQRAGKEHRPLRHNTHLAAQLLHRVVAHVHAVHLDAALADLVKAGNEVDQRRFAAAGAADDAQRLAARNGEGDVAERIGARVRVSKADRVKRNLRAALDLLCRAADPVDNRGMQLQHLVHAGSRGGGLGEDDHQVCHHDHGKQNLV